jgi:Protein of unknown function with PCYCGC motif
MWRLVLIMVAAVLGAGLGLAQTPAGKAPPQQAAPARAVTPPIPNPGFAPGRPLDQTRAVYEFAGQHPEILKYVPCYCGCESSGHPHNESCFVKRRDAGGQVLEWDPHGYG